MASPTSPIEPVTTTARFGASAAQARASSSASSSRSTACTRSAPTRAGDGRGEVGGVARAIGVGSGDEERAAGAGEHGGDALGVLVGEHAEHEDDLVEVEVLVERGDERLGAVRVVRGVDDDRRVGGDRLQATRGCRGGESVVHAPRRRGARRRRR